MTFLLNSEISPAFMQDGRVTHDGGEGRSRHEPEQSDNGVFYQLAGRRINWDLTDYHPLLAQRAKSTDTFSNDLQPSVDYQQPTEIREGLDRNFLIILSDDGAKGGGGALATFNRSVGPFQADRTEVTFRSVGEDHRSGRDGPGGYDGVYRSPFSLPNGEILASYDGAVTDPAAGAPRFALVAVNEQTGARRCSPATAPSRTWRPRWATSGASSCCSATSRSWCSAATWKTQRFTPRCTSPTRPCWRRCWAPTCASTATWRKWTAPSALRIYEEHPPPSSMPEQLVHRPQHLGAASFEADHS
jgi:hypothetical protein